MAKRNLTRQKAVHVHLSDSERAALDAACARYGLSQASYIRLLLTGALPAAPQGVAA